MPPVSGRRRWGWGGRVEEAHLEGPGSAVRRRTFTSWNLRWGGICGHGTEDHGSEQERGAIHFQFQGELVDGGGVRVCEIFFGIEGPGGNPKLLKGKWHKLTLTARRPHLRASACAQET